LFRKKFKKNQKTEKRKSYEFDVNYEVANNVHHVVNYEGMHYESVNYNENDYYEINYEEVNVVDKSHENSKYPNIFYIPSAKMEANKTVKNSIID